MLRSAVTLDGLKDYQKSSSTRWKKRSTTLAEVYQKPVLGSKAFIERVRKART
jgi:hypothetical protein